RALPSTPTLARSATRRNDEFLRVRESLLSAYRKFGPTGQEDSSNESSSFYLVADQHNNDRYQYLEIYAPVQATGKWLGEMINYLSWHSEWAIVARGRTYAHAVRSRVSSHSHQRQLL